MRKALETGPENLGLSQSSASGCRTSSRLLKLPESQLVDVGDGDEKAFGEISVRQWTPKWSVNYDESCKREEGVLLSPGGVPSCEDHAQLEMRSNWGADVGRSSENPCSSFIRQAREEGEALCAAYR